MVSFNEALRVFENSNGRYTGIGIAMMPEAGLVGVDLDDCLNNGEESTQNGRTLSKGRTRK